MASKADIVPWRRLAGEHARLIIEQEPKFGDIAILMAEMKVDQYPDTEYRYNIYGDHGAVPMVVKDSEVVVPRYITSLIENPIEFYAKLRGKFAIRLELDPVVHSVIMGRDVTPHPNVCIYYDRRGMGYTVRVDDYEESFSMRYASYKPWNEWIDGIVAKIRRDHAAV